MGIIAAADKPKMPFYNALSDFMMHLKNISYEEKDKRRKIVLGATFSDLKRVAREYLSEWNSASFVVITGKQNREMVEKMGFEIRELS